MEIRGPDNTSRPNLDRASDSRKAERLKQIKSAGIVSDTSSEGDSIEVSTSRLIRESVDELLDQLERRVTETGGRRDELLGRADDPAAVRRAARGMIASEDVSGTDRV